MTSNKIRVVMMGASGAVGSQVLLALKREPVLEKLTLLSRRILPHWGEPPMDPQVVDVLNPLSYRALLPGHHAAVCTLGVGQPSAVSREEFLRVDRDAVVDFARSCKDSGVEHFELLSSVGANPMSRSHYLRAKGELNESLVALNFARLSIFQPSIIVTPTNRYGVSQGLLLAVWPQLNGLLRGAWRQYRGVPVETLGCAIAANLFTVGSGVEPLHWDDCMRLGSSDREGL